MKVSLPMLRAMGACDPGAGSDDGYVSRWFIENNVDIIDYDLSMEILKTHAEMGQQWIEDNSANNTIHNNFQDWVTWYERLPTMLEAITYFGDHIVENTFKTTYDDLLHESLEEAINHKNRLINELHDDYITKVVINGVVINGDESETWERINNIENEDLSRFSCFVCNDIFTGINHKISSKEGALLHRSELITYINNMVDSFGSSIHIHQKYTDESGKYSIWVKL